VHPRRSYLVFAAGVMLALHLVAAPGRAQQTPDPQLTAQEVRGLFDRFVLAQNAHNLAAVGELLSDSPGFLWITGGVPIRGREGALKRFEALYQGTWHLAPRMDELQVTLLSETVAQLYVPIDFTIGPAGQAATTTRFLMNQVLVKTAKGWQVASILPIAVPKP
jgi:hypothetical protein